ncbi:MAG: lysophospholipase L1-like esterase [Verrucomicrobiales bacterium]
MSVTRSNNWKKFALLVASLLFMEGVARVYVRWVAPTPIRHQFSVFEDLPSKERRVTPHPYLGYTNTPSYQRDAVHHNSLGWRGPETTLDKPEGTFRILAMGGSTTYTEAVADDAKTFPAQLQRILHEEHGLTQIEVINAGIPGYNSWESLINLCVRGLEMGPDLVIIHHGANDVHSRFVRPGTYRADNRGRRKAWDWQKLSWMEENLTLYRILTRLKRGTHIGLEPFVDASDYVGPFSTYGEPELQFDTLLDQHPPTHFQNNLRNMAAICREHEVAVLLTTWAWCPYFEKDYASFPFYQRGFREVNQTVLDLAKTKELPAFDFASQMSQNRNHWHDGRHVNEAGSLLKAQLFAAYLVESNLIQASHKRP